MWFEPVRTDLQSVRIKLNFIVYRIATNVKRIKKHKPLPSFTLFEVLLAMTISGIIISILSILFLNFNKTYQLKKSLAKSNEEILELFSAIRIDAFHATSLKRLSFGFKIENNDGEVIYEIYKDEKDLQKRNIILLLKIIK